MKCDRISCTGTMSLAASTQTVRCLGLFREIDTKEFRCDTCSSNHLQKGTDSWDTAYQELMAEALRRGEAYMILNWIGIQTNKKGVLIYSVEAITPEEWEDNGGEDGGANGSGPVTAERRIYPKNKRMAVSESILIGVRSWQMRLGWLVAPHLLDIARQLEGKTPEEARSLFYGKKIPLVLP